MRRFNGSPHRSSLIPIAKKQTKMREYMKHHKCSSLSIFSALKAQNPIPQITQACPRTHMPSILHLRRRESIHKMTKNQNTQLTFIKATFRLLNRKPSLTRSLTLKVMQITSQITPQPRWYESTKSDLCH